MKIDFAVSDYFEGIFRVFGWILIPVSVFAFMQSLVAGLIILLLVVIIFTTKYRLKIDPPAGIYKEYLWILGFANGEERPFRTIGSVFVRAENYSQRISSVVATKEFRFTVYSVYIIVDNEELFAGEFKEPAKANERARSLSKKLKTGHYDIGSGKRLG